MINDFSPTYVKFDGVRKLCLQIYIEGDDYKLCERTSSNQWNNKKVGKYGGGIVNKRGDPYKVERVGLLGEMAVSILFDLPIDTEYQEYGKKSDFFIKSLSVDVKTSSKLSKGKNPSSYIFAGPTKEKRLKNPIKSDIYICCIMEQENRKEGMSSLLLVGWEHKSVIEKFPRVPSRLSSQTHYNYELPFKSLRSIADLYILMEMRQV